MHILLRYRMNKFPTVGEERISYLNNKIRSLKILIKETYTNIEREKEFRKRWKYELQWAIKELKKYE